MIRRVVYDVEFRVLVKEKLNQVDSVLVTGSCEQLGEWLPQRAVVLTIATAVIHLILFLSLFLTAYYLGPVGYHGSVCYSVNTSNRASYATSIAQAVRLAQSQQVRYV